MREGESTVSQCVSSCGDDRLSFVSTGLLSAIMGFVLVAGPGICLARIFMALV